MDNQKGAEAGMMGNGLRLMGRQKEPVVVQHRVLQGDPRGIDKA